MEPVLEKSFRCGVRREKPDLYSEKTSMGVTHGTFREPVFYPSFQLPDILTGY